jgi:hypothetical protein
MLLSITKLPKSTLQPLVDRITDKLPDWKGWLMHRSSHLILVKTTLSAIPMYTSISIGLPRWLIKALQKILKVFLWSSSEVIQNGKCIVALSRMQRHLHLGGMGIMDLRLLGIALRVR